MPRASRVPGAAFAARASGANTAADSASSRSASVSRPSMHERERARVEGRRARAHVAQDPRRASPAASRTPHSSDRRLEPERVRERAARERAVAQLQQARIDHDACSCGACGVHERAGEHALHAFPRDAGARAQLGDRLAVARRRARRRRAGSAGAGCPSACAEFDRMPRSSPAGPRSRRRPPPAPRPRAPRRRTATSPSRKRVSSSNDERRDRRRCSARARSALCSSRRSAAGARSSARAPTGKSCRLPRTRSMRRCIRRARTAARAAASRPVRTSAVRRRRALGTSSDRPRCAAARRCAPCRACRSRGSCATARYVRRVPTRSGTPPSRPRCETNVTAPAAGAVPNAPHIGSIRTGSGVGIDAPGSPIAAYAIAPPLMTSSGRKPKNAGFHSTRSASFPTLDRPDVLGDPVRDRRVDRVLRDVPFHAQVVAALGFARQRTALHAHLVRGLPRPHDHFADAAHRLRVGRHHADRAEVVQACPRRRSSRRGCASRRTRRPRGSTDRDGGTPSACRGARPGC